jgi:cytochrome c oxidase subunit IV
MADTHTHAPETAQVDHTSGHPTWRTYVVVGFILTAITGLEVALFYIPSAAGILVPALLTLSAIKFAIVVLFYMHLKFDDRLFSRVFVAPLFLAALVVIGMIILFKVLPGLELS